MSSNSGPQDLCEMSSVQVDYCIVLHTVNMQLSGASLKHLTEQDNPLFYTIQYICSPHITIGPFYIFNCLPSYVPQKSSGPELKDQKSCTWLRFTVQALVKGPCTYIIHSYSTTPCLPGGPHLKPNKKAL